MRSVKGKFCGDFKPPKEPFTSSPFFGEYSSTGGGRLGYGRGTDDSTTQPAPVAPQPAEPTVPEEDTAPSGGTEFDPEQYESAPQGPPDTEVPPGGGTTP